MPTSRTANAIVQLLDGQMRTKADAMKHSLLISIPFIALFIFFKDFSILPATSENIVSQELIINRSQDKLNGGPAYAKKNDTSSNMIPTNTTFALQHSNVSSMSSKGFLIGSWTADRLCMVTPILLLPETQPTRRMTSRNRLLCT